VSNPKDLVKILLGIPIVRSALLGVVFCLDFDPFFFFFSCSLVGFFSFIYYLFIYLFITSSEALVQNESFKKLTLFNVLCNVLGPLHIGTCLAQR